MPNVTPGSNIRLDRADPLPAGAETSPSVITLSDNFNFDGIGKSTTVFIELAQRRQNVTRYHALVKELRGLSIILQRDAIADRLEILIEDFLSDFERCIDTDSLISFKSFFIQYPNLKRPLISATSNGNLFAEWKSEDGRYFLGADFTPTRQVRFIANRPNTDNPAFKNYVTGITPISQLFEELIAYKLESWACLA